jgi:TPP-dependent 2-oxoacid decarboxylase
MGFGLPAALGAAATDPDLPVIDIDGDGSFIMNVQVRGTPPLILAIAIPEWRMVIASASKKWVCT